LARTRPAFSACHASLGPDSEAPGLLAAADHLDALQLVQAYRQGIFPWFSPGQPVLWWSPDPRMVLPVNGFKLHRSLRQTLKNWTLAPGVEMVFDRDFAQVISRCGQAPRPGQTGTWIVPAIVAAYTQLHRMGLAHSAEIWQDGQLVAGLYFVSLGHAVFGESMFTTVRDGSKMALAMLVSVAKRHGVEMIDCQQTHAIWRPWAPMKYLDRTLCTGSHPGRPSRRSHGPMNLYTGTH